MFTSASKAASGSRVTATAFGELLLPPVVSFHRYEALRRALGFSDQVDEHPVDAALFLGGVDSRDDPVNSSVLTHLLVGTASTVLPADLDDVMLIVHAGGATLYCAPTGLYAIALVTKLWPHLTVVCLPQSKFNDQTVFENDKMTAFRAMVRPHARIGMVWSATRPDAVRHKAGVVEGWPIVQSYAFDERGARPFFSMDKQVVDVIAAVMSCIAAPLDAYEVVHSFGLTAELIALQFEAALAWAEQSSADLFQLPLNQAAAEMVKTLSLFHEHCSLAVADDGVIAARQAATGGSGRAFATSELSSTTFVTSASGQRRGVVLRLSHPWLPVAVTRTYALNAADAERAITLEALQLAAVTLRQLAVDAFGDAGLPPPTVPDSVADWAARLWSAQAQTHAQARKAHAAVLSRYVRDQRLTACVVYLEIAHGDDDSTAATVGDTFLVVFCGDGRSSIVAPLTSCVPYIDAVCEARGAATSIAPVLVAQADVPPSKRASAAVPACPELGKLLVDVSRADGVAVVVGRSHNVAGSSTGAIAYLCEGGFVVVHKRLGILGPCLAPHLSVFNPSDTSSPIIVEWSAPEGSVLGAGVSVSLHFKASSYGRREFLANVLPSWRASAGGVIASSAGITGDDATSAEHFVSEQLKSPLTTGGRSDKMLVSSVVPAALQRLQPFPQSSGAGGESSSSADDEDPESQLLRRDAAAREAITAALPGLVFASYALHALTSNNNRSVANPTVEGLSSDRGSVSQVILHIVSGPISSNKHKAVAALLKTLSTEAAAARQTETELRVRSIVPSFERCMEFSTKAFEIELAHLIARECAAARPEPLPGRPAFASTRLVIVVQLPPSATMPAVVPAVAAAGSGLGLALRIASSTAVANTDSFYGDHGLEPPALPAQGAWRCLVPGFVDTVLVTSMTRYSKVSAARVERSIRHAFGAANFPSAIAAVGSDLPVNRSESASLILADSSESAPFRFVYGHDEFVQRCLTAQDEAVKGAVAGVMAGRLAHEAHVSVRRVIAATAADTSYSLQTCAASLAYQPRHVSIHFDRMALIEPDVRDFLEHFSDPSELSPFVSAFRVKAEIFMEGRPYELTAARHRGHLCRLRRRGGGAEAAGGAGLRQEQTFHFFLGGEWTDRDNIESMERYLLRFVAFRGSLVGDILLPRERAEDATSTTAQAAGAARTRHAELRPLICRADLTDNDVSTIVEDATRKGLPLPEHWSFDGFEYRHRETGECSSTRPDAEDLATEFIARRNAAANEHNAQVARRAGTSTTR